MKIKSGYLVKKIADSYVIISVGQEANYDSIMTLSESASDVFNWILEGSKSFEPDQETLQEYMKNPFVEYSYEELLLKLLDTYELSEEMARNDLTEFLNDLESKGILIR
ncbi:MAG: PqqD family protein [Bacillales bacterium]|jgi:hypothetical protein|nr:PqqD family protein [Bacillales bacterium]